MKQAGEIRIDKEGQWFFNNLPIINRMIYLFFCQHVEPAAGGGYQLRVGQETCPLVVEDTPFVVTRIVPAGLEGFIIKLNDETEEALDLNTFFIGRKNIPYCRVKDRKFPARFLRAPYYALAEHIEEGSAGKFFLVVGSQRVYITHEAETP